MRDCAAEINCKPRLSAEPTLAATETNCAARRTSPNDWQTSVAVATRLPPRRLMDNYSSQPGLTASLQQYTVANLELFTVTST